MKTLAALFAILSIAACTESEARAPELLGEDAYFIAVFSPHTSPQDCLDSPDPRGCLFAITLCADGRAAERIADIVSEGSYGLLGTTAHATHDDGTSFEFDVDTRVKVGDSPNTTWVVDTENFHETQFDTIDCSAP